MLALLLLKLRLSVPIVLKATVPATTRNLNPTLLEDVAKITCAPFLLPGRTLSPNFLTFKEPQN
jgi:hypothetical protein